MCVPVCLHEQEKTVEISMQLSAKQLDHVAPVLEEVLQELMEDPDNGSFQTSAPILPCVILALINASRSVVQLRSISFPPKCL